MTIKEKKNKTVLNISAHFTNQTKKCNKLEIASQNQIFALFGGV